MGFPSFADEFYLRGRKQGYNPTLMSIPNLLRTASLLIGSLFLGAAYAQHDVHGRDPVNDAVVHAIETDPDAPDLIEEEVEHNGGRFNAGKLIMDHIGDEHGWHLFGHTTLPLPVILYDTQRGSQVFSSSRFEHGHASYNGYALVDHEVVAVTDTKANGHAPFTVDEAATKMIWDISITKNVLSLFISLTVLVIIFITVAKAYTRRTGQAPTGLQNLVEPIILFVRDDVAKSAIGEKKYMKFMPYLLTAFFFIFLNNLMGLVPFFPGGANLTGNIAVTLVMALITFIIVTVNGNKHYWGHILAMPGVPGWVLAILTPVEILGMFLKPFVLMIRLFANITAGHIIALSFFSLIFVFGETSTGAGLGVGIFSLAFTIFMTMLELLVAFIQAYVFTFLSAMYIGSAVEEPHHH